MNEVKEVNINVPKKAVVFNNYTKGASNAVYGLGLIGATIYFFQQASGFSEYIVGFLKALVWPAYLVYELFKYLGVS